MNTKYVVQPHTAHILTRYQKEPAKGDKNDVEDARARSGTGDPADAGRESKAGNSHVKGRYQGQGECAGESEEENRHYQMEEGRS